MKTIIQVNDGPLSDEHMVMTTKGFVMTKDLRKSNKLISIPTDFIGKIIKIERLIKPKAKKRIKSLTKKEISDLKKKLKQADDELDNIKK